MRKPVAVLGVTMLVAAGVNLFGAISEGNPVYWILSATFAACALATFVTVWRLP